MDADALGKPGPRISSTPFEAFGLQWRLRLTPPPEGGKSVRLTVELLSEDARVHLKFNVSVGAHACFPAIDKTLENSVAKKGSWMGYVLDAETVRKQVVDGGLCVTCVIERVAVSVSGEEKPLRGQTLLQCVRDSIDSIETDAVFVCGDGTRVPAHKFVMAARSPALRALFSSAFATTSECTVPAHISSAAFSTLRTFCYTDDADCESLEEASDVLRAANFYGVERLQAACEQFITRSLTPQNAAGIYALAAQLHADELRKASVQFIAENVAAVMDTEGWELMHEEGPRARDELIRALAEDSHKAKRARKGAQLP
jgi:speckle-type POZ protein